MFNSAFSEAGAACTIKTVEQLTNIRIDHYVVVDFGGFKDMVNALGGVKVCLPQDVNDPQSHLVLDQGHAHREGPAGAGLRAHPARARQRQRHRPDRPPAGVPRLDGHQDQEQGPAAPARTGCCSFLGAATNSLTTDPGLGSLNALRKLAQDVKGIDTKNVTFLTAPNEPYPADPNRVQLKPSAATVWNALRLDQPLPGKDRSPRRPRPPRRAARRWSPRRRTSASQVLNGSGVTGAASKLAERADAPPGSTWSSVGDADRAATTRRPRSCTTRRTTSPGAPSAPRSPARPSARTSTLGSTLRVIVGSRLTGRSSRSR